MSDCMTNLRQQTICPLSRLASVRLDNTIVGSMIFLSQERRAKELLSSFTLLMQLFTEHKAFRLAVLIIFVTAWLTYG